MERVRMHPYLTQRTFSRSPRLARLAEVAAAHHERLDGSGYPRGLAGGALSPEARILAAADAYQAMTELRPHRPARSPDDAARPAAAEDVSRGRLDRDAVDAVLGAAGHRVPRRREGPAGLTQREVEVLVLLARGLSNKAIAAQLVVSPRTVGHHIEHIYRKIGCSTRAAASLFAMQHGLLPELEPAPEDGANDPMIGPLRRRSVAGHDHRISQPERRAVRGPGHRSWARHQDHPAP